MPRRKKSNTDKPEVIEEETSITEQVEEQEQSDVVQVDETKPDSKLPVYEIGGDVKAKSRPEILQELIDLFISKYGKTNIQTNDSLKRMIGEFEAMINLTLNNNDFNVFKLMFDKLRHAFADNREDAFNSIRLTGCMINPYTLKPVGRLPYLLELTNIISMISTDKKLAGIKKTGIDLSSATSGMTEQQVSFLNEYFK